MKPKWLIFGTTGQHLKQILRTIGERLIALEQQSPKIYKLHKQKKKISIPKYIQLFKECIQKMNINKDSAAIPFFTQGLQLDVLEKCMMQNPDTLQGWYSAMMRVSNTKSRIGILSSLAHAGKGGGSSHRDQMQWM